MIVVRALAPMILRFTGTVRCSTYFAAATRMESPDEESEIAWAMVLQAVSGDLQSLLFLPLTPFTCHVGGQCGRSCRKNHRETYELQNAEFHDGPLFSRKWLYDKRGCLSGSSAQRITPALHSFTRQREQKPDTPRAFLGRSPVEVARGEVRVASERESGQCND